MAKYNALEVFDMLKQQLDTNNKGEITFKLSDFKITVQQNNVVGNILEEWLDKWMTKNNIDHVYNHSQSSPDFWLNVSQSKDDWLEIKSFTGSPNFDIGNFMSYISDAMDKPWKLQSNYLLIEYRMDMETGIITINNVWLKKVWEISCPSAKWAVKVQDKKNIIYNLRPATWYSEKTDFDVFNSLEDFLSALDFVIKTYPGTAKIGLDWKRKVEKAYNDYYKKLLNIPLWQDIVQNYPKK